MSPHEPPDWVLKAIANQPPFLTTDETAELLRTTPRNVYRMIADGRIRTVRPATSGSSRHLIPKSSIADYLASLEVA